MSTWEPETEEEQPKKPEYQVRAHLVLEDSNKETWGMVKDTEGNISIEAGEGILVGQWSRSPVDNLVHVFLETPVMALVDKATQKFAEYAEKRRVAATAPKTTRARVSRAPKPAPEPSEDLIKISNLRKLISK